MTWFLISVIHLLKATFRVWYAAWFNLFCDSFITNTALNPFNKKIHFYSMITMRFLAQIFLFRWRTDEVIICYHASEIKCYWSTSKISWNQVIDLYFFAKYPPVVAHNGNSMGQCLPTVAPNRKKRALLTVTLACIPVPMSTSWKSHSTLC